MKKKPTKNTPRCLYPSVPGVDIHFEKKTSANSTSIPGVYIHLYRVFISTSNKHHQISTSIPGVPFWKTTSSTSTPGVCISIATLLLRVAAVIASHVARWSLPDDAQPHRKKKNL